MGLRKTSLHFRLALLMGLLLLVTDASPTPQSITWFYANDLGAGASFLTTLGLVEVPDLIQRDKCRIFHSTDSDASFLGVCNTRAAPSCTSPASGDTEAVTFTLVVESRAAVDAIHAELLPVNGSEVFLTPASGSSAWGAYGFNAYDVNTSHGLGCYRMEVQSFDDLAWPPRPASLDLQLRDQLRQAGEELSFTQPSAPGAGPINCPCADFCSGRCFAPGCKICPASIWDNDEASCRSAGPLGHGLLCAPDNDQAPCCSPNGTACQLVGRQWCDCSKYPPQPPLFPQLRNRSWTKAGGCKTERV